MSNIRNTGLFNRTISMALFISLVLAQTGCSADIEAEMTESGMEETSIVSESTAELPRETSFVEETTVPTTFDDLFAVETEPVSNPFGISTTSDQYNAIVGEVLGAGPLWMLQYGFDNEITQNALREQIYNTTGIQDDSITLSDVGYFQGTTRVTDLGGISFSECFDGVTCSPYLLSYVRAVLQINGWRFGIDEIPYVYLMERFPAYMTSINETGGYPGSFTGDDPYFYEVIDPLAFENMYNYDLTVFTALTIYNNARVSYVYDSPYGNPNNTNDDILQVRDAATGRNVLVPTEEQYRQMMDDITSIPGCENVDIAVVETRENFYESYGYYPEDLINDELIYEGNRNE